MCYHNASGLNSERPPFFSQHHSQLQVNGHEGVLATLTEITALTCFTQLLRQRLPVENTNSLIPCFHRQSAGVLTQCASTSGQHGRLSTKEAAGKQQETSPDILQSSSGRIPGHGGQQDWLRGMSLEKECIVKAMHTEWACPDNAVRMNNSHFSTPSFMSFS